MMGYTEFAEDSVTDSPWSLAQIMMAAACFLPMTAFSKLPLDFFFGSGWSLMTYIAFMLIIAFPTIYVQFRFGARYKRGLLCILEKYSPWTLCFTIGTVILNLLHLILGSVWIAYAISYVFFTFFHCDGKYCTGASFMWGSCSDRWSEGDCKEFVEILSNFILMRETTLTRFGGFANWFDLSSLPILPYLFGWFLVLLLAVGGARVFGLLLLAFGPICIALLAIVTAFIGIEYANSEKFLTDYANRFYLTFSAHKPTPDTGYDLYKFQPLIWGFLSTFVHLSQAMRLWNGVYPVLGRWIGEGRFRRHLAWIPLLMVFTIVGQIPVLLIMFSVSSSFSMRSVRCYLALDWALPFIIIPHVFSKFSTHIGIASCFVFGLFFALLLSQTLLLICTLENIIDHLNKWYESVEIFRMRTYRILLFGLIGFLLCPLGILFMTRSGFYWIRIADRYVERLQVVLVFAQSVGFLILYGEARFHS
ncbi:hypothetical protein Ciccas_009735 [Cichlidogyrus casuarinus]|uniref:Uncharacterized protein n=1 Tax=Cichlidogyrus casuarinus TaxID=1844966 RepID=A0ABD2PW63_9PLAT